MEEAVSTFLVDSSRVKPQPQFSRFYGWVGSVQLSSDRWTLVDVDVKSHMDFMYKDDSDKSRFIWRSAHSIAVQSQQQLPQRLPATFSDELDVYQIVDFELPGFARLMPTDCRLRILPGSNSEYVRLPVENWDSIAYRYVPSGELVSYYYDVPITERCLEWPSQAADWPTRHRPFGWPDDPTVHQVVASGCDLIHRRRHVCGSVHESNAPPWNFIFPDAEAILLNTWTPTQQTVYHVLSLIVRREFDQYRCVDGYRMVCVQVLKTLMMWVSEVRGVGCWWTRSSVVRTCALVMQLLMQRYERQSCDGYFIMRANMLECPRTQSVIRRMKQFVDVDYVTCWILNNYVCQCLKLCPRSALRLPNGADSLTYESVKSSMKAAVEWRSQRAWAENLRNTDMIMLQLPLEIGKAKRKMSLKSIASWRKDFLEVDQRFDGYFVSVICLTMTTELKETSSAVPDDVCDIVAAMVTSIDKCNKMSVVQKSDRFLLKKAMYLLRLSWQISCHVTSSILQVLARAYLRRAQKIKPKTAYKNSTFLLTNVYLAVFYFVAGRHEAAENRCKRVTSLNNHTTCNLAEGHHLLSIDNGTDVVSGAILLYHFLQTAALSLPREKGFPRVDVFSADLLVRYLLFVIRSASGKKAVTSYLFRHYIRHLRKTRTLYSGDMMLCYLVSCQKTNLTCNLDKTKRLSSAVRFNAKELRQLLVDFAFEKIAQFQQLVHHSPENVIPETIVTAMLDYHRGHDNHCFRLSKRIANCWWDTADFGIMPVYGCMTHLLDVDLASLVGVYSIAGQHHCGYVMHKTLTLYLLVQSQLRMLTASTNGSISDVLEQLQTYVLKRLGSFYEQRFDMAVMQFIYRKAIIHTQRHFAVGGMQK
jgi:hypothetical protein